jgi:hypothetical protein
MPPLTVARVNGALVLVDGWHRLGALHQIGRWEAEVNVVDATERETYWLAARANLTHGLPLKPRELRKVFRSYVRARQHRDGDRIKSYREIAEETGGNCGHTTVRNWMFSDFPKIAREMGGKDDVVGNGGDYDVPAGPSFKDTASAALQDALVAFRAVDDPYTGEA